MKKTQESQDSSNIVFMYIPGLGDKYDKYRQRKLEAWRKKGLIVCFFPMKWESGRSLKMQIAPLVEEILERAKIGKKVILIGESAGATVALTLLTKLSPAISGVITVAGVVHPDAPIAPALYKKNPSLKDSMQSLKRAVAALKDEHKKKIVTVYGLGDRTVRREYSTIEGVLAKRLFQPSHMLTVRRFLNNGRGIANEFARTATPPKQPQRTGTSRVTTTKPTAPPIKKRRPRKV